MAVTFTGNYSVFGDRVTVFGDITLDANNTSGAVELPGVKNLDFAHVTPKAAQSAGTDAVVGITTTVNKGSGGTTIGGMLRMQSGISGSVYTVIAFGR
jgi:hypothetical protein